MALGLFFFCMVLFMIYNIFLYCASTREYVKSELSMFRVGAIFVLALCQWEILIAWKCCEQNAMSIWYNKQFHRWWICFRLWDKVDEKALSLIRSGTSLTFVARTMQGSNPCLDSRCYSFFVLHLVNRNER